MGPRRPTPTPWLPGAAPTPWPERLATDLGIEPRPVKARLLGPYTAGARTGGDRRRRRRATMAAAAAGNEQLRALFAAGAPIVQVEEDGLAEIEPDDGPRTGWRSMPSRRSWMASMATSR